jgi:SAM-dependent methyltransferase
MKDTDYQPGSPWRCAVCGGDRGRSMGPIAGFELLRCRRCGLGHAVVGVEDLRDFYDEAYFRGEKARYAQREDQPLSAAQQYWVDRFVPLRGSALLEIGPGPGAGVARYLAASRPEVAYEAVDVSATVAGALQRREIECHLGAVHTPAVVEACRGRFDAAVAVEVIEHDSDPRRFAEASFSALRPGGVLCLTTGNFDGWVARLWGRRWYYLDPPAHVFYYTPRSIRRLLGEAGFGPMEIHYTGFRYIEKYLDTGIRAFLSVPHLLRLPTGMTVVAHRPR